MKKKEASNNKREFFFQNAKHVTQKKQNKVSRNAYLLYKVTSGDIIKTYKS